jgi:hypothetical protein
METKKIRCEAGTYAWLQENCPDVLIPKLYGFSLSTAETVWAPHPSQHSLRLVDTI